MAMRKNLDERAKKKNLNEIFQKFDKNNDGRIFARDLVKVCSLS